MRIRVVRIDGNLHRLKMMALLAKVWLATAGSAQATGMPMHGWAVSLYETPAR